MALCAATVLYLGSFPLVLGAPDEGHQLHDAQRILAGEVLYRDVFEIILPGWMYLMAVLFRLFGTTLAAARMTAAVIHGAIVACVFLACRQLGVRRALACAVAPLCLVVCQPAYPVASQHWLTTLFCALLLVVALEMWRGTSWVFAAGVVAALAVAVHQQRGMVMAAGVAAFLLADAALSWRYRIRPAPASLRGRLVALAGGALVVLLPMLAAIVLSAGFEPVWRDLVLFPLMDYPGVNNYPWGFIGETLARLTPTFPRLLAALPIALVLPVSGMLVLWVRRSDVERARALTVLIFFSVASSFSVWYLPDFIHLAFIAPIFFVVLGEGSERILRLLPRRIDAVLGSLVAACLLTASSVRLQRNLAGLRAHRPIAYASAAGRVELGPMKAALYRELDGLLRSVPSRTLYAHPIPGYTYLLLGARNPTRFEFVLAGYHDAEQMREVIDTLAATDLPYVVLEPGATRPDDPVARFIHERYDPLPAKAPIAGWIWKRK